ncbi:hypothetical protein SASPL_148504 [Salvia splendens]|uniref:Uncharacterized protein n=1 Tax=Salvia splendens TaxID=180675 RepID=A0A8X8WAT0_SALSN|nr:hypothetical protein SASPL_148504 [Salvia splendens]
MDAVVIDAGSKMLKSGFAVPDQPPSMNYFYLSIIQWMDPENPISAKANCLSYNIGRRLEYYSFRPSV